MHCCTLKNLRRRIYKLDVNGSGTLMYEVDTAWSVGFWELWLLVCPNDMRKTAYPDIGEVDGPPYSCCTHNINMWS